MRVLGPDHTIRRTSAWTACAAALALTVTTVSPAGAAPQDSEGLQEAVTLSGLLAHTRAFQQLADATGGNRAAGTPGHAASAGYVLGQLQAAGYRTTLQEFEFPYFDETAPAELEVIAPTAAVPTVGTDFATMTYSGSGDVQAPVSAVDVTLPPGAEPGSTSGCEDADFAGFTAGHIALLQRGTCTFGEKALNAQEAGAVGVIIFNEGQEGRTELLQGTLGAPDITIPVVGSTFALGELLSAEGTVVQITTATESQTRSTFNVIAETAGGRADNVVMLGAHLDSVPEGPGINDNGSGSSALLEIATQLPRELDRPNNKVRFAWWSAEEFGLLGAAHYVEQATSAELGDIAVYLNFDMIASPNAGRFVYDGDDSDDEGAGEGPQGSAEIEEVLTGYFAEKDLPTEGTDFDGRSDYGPFIDAGIPSGGIFTGAEDIKTKEQAAKFGGRADVAFDPCYHQACDTTRNLNHRAFAQNADAIAHLTATFAESTESVNGRDHGSSIAASALRTARAEVVRAPHGVLVR